MTNKKFGKFRYFALLTFLHENARKAPITGITEVMAAFGVNHSTSSELQSSEMLEKNGLEYRYLIRRKPTLQDAKELLLRTSRRKNTPSGILVA